ncbi:unnamed protein product [Closterium sp. NIES-65]|nr:unnamed protein product [Closterium sp. NIES-65]
MSNDGNTQISPSFIPSPPVIPPPLARPTRWQCLAFPLASSPGDDGNTHIFTFLIPLPPVTLRCPPSPAVAPRHPPLPPVTLRCSSSPCPRLLPLLGGCVRDGSTRHGGSVPHPSLAFLFFASLFLRSPSFLPLSHCQVGVFEMAAQGMVAVPNPSLTFLLFTQKSLIPNHHPLYPYSQVGVFEMAAQGMVAVPNPSLAFLPASRTRGSAAVAVVMHGSRPLLLEVQEVCSTVGSAAVAVMHGSRPLLLQVCGCGCDMMLCGRSSAPLKAVQQWLWALCVKTIPNIPPIKSANGVDMHRQRSGHASPTEWTCIASPSSPQSSYPLLLSRHQALCVKAIPNILPTKTANGVDMYRLTIHKSFLASPLFYHIHVSLSSTHQALCVKAIPNIPPTKTANGMDMYLLSHHPQVLASLCPRSLPVPSFPSHQALCVKAIPNIPPTKTANGVDMYRLTILTKIMRHIGLPIGSKDVVVNVVGGMQVKEPAADLAIAVAIASSLYESPVPADTAFIGEIGLNGELRGVIQLDRRVNEVAKLGFSRCVVPAKQWKGQAAPSGLAPAHAADVDLSPAELEAAVRRAVAKVVTRAKAPGALRIVFHDAGTYDLATNTGGMNGSVRFELKRPENDGLKRTIKVLEKARLELGPLANVVSWADLMAVAGAYAVESCGGPHIPVRMGRRDASGPDPENRMPAETLNAKEVVASFKSKGFSLQETVCLLGAHTLGGKGFGDATSFDNAYYSILLTKPWLDTSECMKLCLPALLSLRTVSMHLPVKSMAGNSMADMIGLPSATTEHDWNSMADMIGLPSDKAIVADEDCLVWINKYASNQDLFFRDFVPAYTKMVNSGAVWA